MTGFESGDLRIAVTAGDDGVTSVVWSGTSDARDPAALLNPFFSELVETLEGRTVTVDLRSLEYMNSATVSALIVFARLLDGKKVPTKLLLDPSVGWQRVNFVAMKSIARTLTHLTVEG
ncbi:MAG: hypothetical protein KF850_17960 [Labilithrix sp.]|nr:hypothetical protein [Labilithrix sp.]MBX3213925.1 hypothetical protein [Labilithrix sp.]